MTKLELENVTYAYPGSFRPSLASISCTIATGELVALTGSNGSGKSSLAKIIAGIIEPDEGEIRGRRNPELGWNGVALVMQEPSSQLLTASVEEEIAWGLENLQIDRDEIARRVDEALDKFGLTALRSKPPEALADGECQLVAFAANTVMEPDILIFDEATAYLDLRWRKRLWEVAKEAAKRCGVVWITTKDFDRAGVSSVWRLEKGRLDILKR